MPGTEFYKPLVANGPRQIAAPTEADYHRAWRQHALPRADNLLAMAVTGGLIADRLAWVFMAGYQAACRHAFADADIRSWTAFAATEDRSGEAPLPGVALTSDADAGTLSGTKTWVAGARCIEQLIVKVGTGVEADYFLLDRSTPGLTIEPGPQPRFLADLSQGRAHLDRVRVGPEQRLQPTRINEFRALEPLYIYAAFCGFVLGATTEYDLVSCSHDCLDGIEPALATIGLPTLDRENLHKADARAQDLLVRLSGNRLDAAGDWNHDQRLVAMYSKGVRRL